MQQPLVSVVVISYNHGRYITEILNSLKSQTYTNWELIVADDASSDNSVKIFKDWLAINNIVAKEIFHQKNTGLATVLNEAVGLCKGKYLKLIAADDFMHPSCLEKSVSFLEEKGKEYAMVFTDTFCIDENSNALPDFADYDALGMITPQDFRKELIKGNRIAALTVLVRKDVILDTGEYDSKFIIEDYYRWLKINDQYLIAYLPEKLSYYRWHDSNISKTKAERIDIETTMIQMIFDHTGIVKARINDIMYSRYINRKEIPAEMLKLYRKYPFHVKRLVYCIQYHLPPAVYRGMSKIF